MCSSDLKSQVIAPVRGCPANIQVSLITEGGALGESGCGMPTDGEEQPKSEGWFKQVFHKDLGMEIMLRLFVFPKSRAYVKDNTIKIKKRLSGKKLWQLRAWPLHSVLEMGTDFVTLPGKFGIRFCKTKLVVSDEHQESFISMNFNIRIMMVAFGYPGHLAGKIDGYQNSLNS